MSYINTHQVIHNLREQAKESGGQGPRVVVAGPTDSGKSTMCRMLLNWAVRAQHQPTYVDLDIGEAHNRHKYTEREGVCVSVCVCVQVRERVRAGESA